MSWRKMKAGWAESKKSHRWETETFICVLASKLEFLQRDVGKIFVSPVRLFTREQNEMFHSLALRGKQGKMVSTCSLRFGIQNHLSLPDACAKHPLHLGDHWLDTRNYCEVQGSMNFVFMRTFVQCLAKWGLKHSKYVDKYVCVILYKI